MIPSLKIQDLPHVPFAERKLHFMIGDLSCENKRVLKWGGLRLSLGAKRLHSGPQFPPENFITMEQRL
jgi:hypothetical protein